MNLKEELNRWGPEASSPRPSLAESQQYCRQLAESHYENFTVVSWLFPRRLHQHLCNVYAYCRWADDLADETESAAESLRLLTWWEEQLEDPTPRHPVFIALQQTMREKQIPQQPFRDLLVAFRQDQTRSRYETWEELQQYCRYSANPVGRIVLHLGESANAANEALSDSICTGLQLINFCQDVRRDFERGRVYLLHLEPKESASDSFRKLIKQEVDRAEELLRAWAPLANLVHRDLKLPVRLFVSGGLAIASAIRQQKYDVWTKRPVVSKWRKLMLLIQAMVPGTRY
jgi:squalene synthase HpnC